MELNKLDAMVQYASTHRCLRQYILQYFGEKADSHCQGCSNCCEVSLGKPVIQHPAEELLNELKAVRLMLAIDEGVPSYHIPVSYTHLDVYKRQAQA